MINLGNTTISAMRLGSTEVVRAYLGDVIVYEADEIDRGAGAVTWGFTNSNRKIAVELQSATGSDSYEYNVDRSILKVVKS